MTTHTSRFLCKRHPSHNAIGVCHLCLEKHLHDLIIKRREQELEGSKSLLQNHPFLIEHNHGLSNGQPKHHPGREAHKQNPKDREREEHGFVLGKAKLHWRGDWQRMDEDGIVVRDGSRIVKGDECAMMMHGGKGEEGCKEMEEATWRMSASKLGKSKEDRCGEKMMSMENQHGGQGRRSSHFACNRNTDVTTTNSARSVNVMNDSNKNCARNENVMKKKSNKKNGNESVIDRDPNQTTFPSSSSSSSTTKASSASSSTSTASNSECSSSKVMGSARSGNDAGGDGKGGNQPRMCVIRSGEGTPEQDILEAVSWSSCGSYRRLHVELEDMREIIGGRGRRSGTRAKIKGGAMEFDDHSHAWSKMVGEFQEGDNAPYRRIHADVDEYGPSIRDPMMMIGSRRRRRRKNKETMPPPLTTTTTLTLHDLLLQEDRDRSQNQCPNQVRVPIFQEAEEKEQQQQQAKEQEEKRPCSASLGPSCDHIFPHHPYHHHLHYYQYHHHLSSRTPPSR